MAAKDPKLSQNKLAAETGLGITTINRLFNNNFRRIDTNTVQTLCKYFACEVGDLLILVPNQASQGLVTEILRSNVKDSDAS